MEENSNYKKLIIINKMLQLVLLIFMVAIIYIFLSRKPYDLSITIFKLMICISLVFVLITCLRKRIQKIIVEECDYEANLLYLNKILKNGSCKTIHQINMLTTYLMLGMYDKAKDVINQLNRKMPALSSKTYLLVYILNLKYFAESGDLENWEDFVNSETSLQMHLDRISNRKRQYFLKKIKLWNEIIKQNWENVVLLLQEMCVKNESQKIIFSYWYAKANENIGKQEEADMHYAYVLSHGKCTIYSKWAQNSMKSNVSQETSVIIKKRQHFDMIVYCAGLFIFALSIICWIRVVYFNTNTETILKEYNFMINQRDIQQVYSESFDEYEFHIFIDQRNPEGKFRKAFFEKDIFYYCILKKEGKYYHLLECFKVSPEEMEEYQEFNGYFDEEAVEDVRITLLQFYIEDYIKKFGEVSEREGYVFPCIGVHSDKEIGKIEVQGNPPELECIKLQETQWYIWKYRNIDYKDVKPDFRS